MSRSRPTSCPQTVRVALTTVFSSLLLFAVFAAPAAAQSIKLQTESRQVYAEMPFVLSVALSGFDEEPEPSLTDLEIPGAQVEYVGMNPQVRSMVRIVNGQRSESRDVTFVHRYKVTVPSAGQYTINPLTATQGTKVATSEAANFEAEAVAETEKMKLRLRLPERPVVVGEEFEVQLDWYLQADPSNPTFVVPFFQHDAISIDPVDDGGRRQRLEFSIDGQQVGLPFTQEKAPLDGQQYTRIRFTVMASATQAGDIQLDPSVVLAGLEVGRTRDRFGFPSARTKLFKATDKARTLRVSELPQVGQPESFSNAVGTGFSIAVEADRTVVKMGDPVELTVTVRGDGQLEGLILPPLSADGGLSTDRFSLPANPPTGRMVEVDGKPARQFVVPVRVKSESVTEIPPIAFSFYNPALGKYETVRSEPIALSVAGANVVGAADVASSGGDGGGGNQPTQSAGSSGNAGSNVSLVGVDLGLSEGSHTLESITTISDVSIWLGLIYLLPLALLGFVVWRRNTSDARQERGERKSARKEMERVVSAARDQPANEASGELSNALRQYAKSLDFDSRGLRTVLERIEVEGYNPAAATRPLPGDLLDQVEELVAEISGGGGQSRSGAAKSATAIAFVCAAGTLLAAQPALAQDAKLDKARELYSQALSEQGDRVRRTAAFERAEARWAELATEYPDRPELLVDWGNAALGAQEPGTAVLAYRRALALDPHNERARKNLTWVRNTLPEWLPRPAASEGASENFFFINRFMSPANRALAGAGFFALFVLLLIPWNMSPALRRGLRVLAVGPFMAWVWFTASIFFAAQPSTDAVVVFDGAVLRSGDNAGAAAAVDKPIPAGAEVAILETRTDWIRVALADGQEGWLRASAIESIPLE